MTERLQFGRDKRPRPRPGPRPGPGSGRTRVDDWSERDYEDHGRLATLAHRYRVRRRTTKARVAAMTRGRRLLRRAMIVATWLLGFVAALMVALIFAYFTLTHVPRPEDLPLAQTATIQYSDGSTLARIGTVDRTLVKLDQVPPQVKWAVLAAEDRGFYRHGAVSIRGTVRAALSDLTGGDTQGGSGITQQYVKNAYLNDEQTLGRKLKELMIAVKLSREYSKDQILEYYLNTVYFGRGAYGIQAAARAYFGVDVGRLSTAQGALLAAVLRAPADYDPADHPEAARQRWTYVLDGMVSTGHLSAAAEDAEHFPVTRPVSSTGVGVTGWKLLVEHAVLAELAEQGVSYRDVIDRGLAIRTTINHKAQTAALAAIRTTFKDLTPKQRNLKNSLVAIDPATGGVLAYYGGSGPGVKGYDGHQDFNDWAQQRANPPGSSFKPYVLATVLTQTIKQRGDPTVIHYAINSKVDGSQCTKVQGTKICNDDSDRSQSGPSVTISHAMRYSLNTTFDQLAVQAGPSAVAATAHAMGVAKVDSDGRPTLVDAHGHTTFGIGIGDYPDTTLDQASGYATLAAGGMHHPAYLVTRATASDGKVLYEHRKVGGRVLDPRVANDVTLTMEDIAGDAGAGLADGRQSAAKTGTEGIFKSANNSDAWMVGYTPQVSAAVWVGTGRHLPIYNADGQPEYGRDLPARTWQAFMDAYLAKAPKLKLASHQMLSEDGDTLDAPPKTSSASAPSSSDTPTPKTSSAAPTTSHAAPTTSPQSSSYTPPPVPSDTVPVTEPTDGCGGLLGPPCSSAAGPSP